MEFFKSLVGGRIKYLLLTILIFVIGTCGFSVGMDVWREWRTPPEQIVGEALMYAVEAPIYSYQSEACRISNGETQVISRLHGEKNGENVHLSGTVDVVDSTVEVYQIGDTFYRQDIVSGSWMEISGYDAEATERLLQEIDPLGCLVYDANAEVTELEKERVQNVKCRKFQVRSSGESTFLTSVWSEFYYTLWVDKARRLQQVEVIAGDHENSEEQLKLQVVFDWNTPVEEIHAPV